MLPKAVQKLIDDFSALPGVGTRSATRMAMYLLDAPESISESMAANISTLKKNVKKCRICYNFSDGEICNICGNEKRDGRQILVVETPLDIIAFEETEFSGVYHVLGGLISPLHGIGPDEIRAEELVTRVKKLSKNNEKLEVIFACPTSLEGESTVTYITNLLKNKHPERLIIQRVASGLPTNSAIEYQDSRTLLNSLQNRIEL